MKLIKHRISGKQQRAKGLELHWHEQKDKTLGPILTAWSDEGLCYMGLTDEKEVALKRYLPHAIFKKSSTPSKDLPFVLYGTEFQLKVWSEIAKIKEGQTISYQDIAKKIKRPKAVRAVGSATGQNPISVLIPCHRVLAKTGVPGQYGWGPAKKRLLLKQENIEI